MRIRYPFISGLKTSVRRKDAQWTLGTHNSTGSPVFSVGLALNPLKNIVAAPLL